MPKWSADVPETPRGHALPIRRTPASKPLQAIVTSTDLIGCDTHYWQGSTCPCEGETCEPCLNGMPFRWHAYMTVVDVHNNLHFIFEVTALTAEFFVAYRDKHMTLRGCQFIARRWNNRPNGRILVQMQPANLGERALPEAPDLKKCMAIIWGISDQEVSTPRRSQNVDVPVAKISKKDQGIK